MTQADRHVERRVLRARAAMVADHTASLQRQDPTWGSRLHPLAGGWLVLAGPGMYVNRAVAVGIDTELGADDLDLIVADSRAAGVVPAVEVTPSTGPSTVEQLRSAGFVHDPDRDVTMLTRPTTPLTGEPEGVVPDDVVVRAVGASPERLRLWQETSVLGWGHDTEEARRASDTYAAAAHATPGEHLVLAFDRVDGGGAGAGRPIGCATTMVRDRVALLGGMTTLPAQRRRGVQAALLRHRVERAAGLGCDLAVATAAAGSASERNLRRHGFAPLTTIETWTRAAEPA